MNKRKKYMLLMIVSLVLLIGCGETDSETPSYSAESLESSQQESEEETTESLFLEYQIILPEGMTLEERFAAPQGYTRTSAEDGSLTTFLREYALKENGSPVLLYNGEEKRNQSVHAAVFTLPIENADLQQCADSIMRVYAEYYWKSGQYEKIAFHFTNGFICDYIKWREGYRVVVSGNDVSWEKSASYDDSYDTFVKYMRMIFNYAGTLSMDMYESETIALSDLEVGDVILKGGSPGHVVMVVDSCENVDGKKAFLFAQGYMPAQEFHVLKNPIHENNPWYYEEEMSFPLKTAEYTFAEEHMIRRLKFNQSYQ